jgi:RNA polymerase sigma-70 factor (ECF subfamily)
MFGTTYIGLVFARSISGSAGLEPAKRQARFLRYAPRGYMDDKAERELISRFQAGEQNAFNVLLEANQQLVLRLAIQLMRHEDSALDVAQEVFLCLFKELPDWRGEARLSTWLYRTTLNISFKHRRSNAQQFKIQNLFQASAESSADDKACNRELLVAINDAVNQLPERQRAVFILRQYENLQFADIASCLEITEGGAKANYHKALMSLREKLKNFAPEPSRLDNNKDNVE